MEGWAACDARSECATLENRNKGTNEAGVCGRGRRNVKGAPVDLERETGEGDGSEASSGGETGAGSSSRGGSGACRCGAGGGRGRRGRAKAVRGVKVDAL